jgi:hypothetical protein
MTSRPGAWRRGSRSDQVQKLGWGMMMMMMTMMMMMMTMMILAGQDH